MGVMLQMMMKPKIMAIEKFMSEIGMLMLNIAYDKEQSQRYKTRMSQLGK